MSDAEKNSILKSFQIATKDTLVIKKDNQGNEYIDIASEYKGEIKDTILKESTEKLREIIKPEW